MEYMLLIIAFLIMINMKDKMNKLESRIKGMQYTLDQITSQLELPENPIHNELRKLIEEGEDVKAVKKARETFGLSLIEGKEYIDKLKNEN